MALLLWLLLIVPLVQGELQLPVRLAKSLVPELNTSALPDAIQDAVSLTASILSKLDPTGVSESILDAQDSAKMEETLAKIMDEVTHVSRQINDLSTQMNSKLIAMTEEITTHQEKFDLLRDFKVIYGNIQYYWDTYVNTLSTRGLHEETVSGFLSAVIAFNTHSPAANLEKLDNLINGNELSNMVSTLPKALLSYYKATELKRCSQGTSDQMDIYYLYNIICMLEKQVMLISIYAYTSKANKKGEYTTEMRQLLTKLQERMDKYNGTIVATMAEASNMIRACDPAGGFKRGKSFAEMERAIQTTLFPTTGKCVELQETYGNERLEPLRRCWINNCRPVEGITVCRTYSGIRRFEWFEEKDSDKKCFGEIRKLNLQVAEVIADTLFFWLYPILLPNDDHRSCLCTCYNDEASHRRKAIISLLPAQADILTNRVVTGVKINQKNNIIQLQVQEGQLGPAGTILKNSTRWVPTENLYYEWHTYTPLGVNGRKLRIYTDYFPLDQYSKTVHLNKISTPKGHVIGGIKFQRGTFSKKNYVYLAVLSVPFDYKTGKLQADSSEWIDMPCKRGKQITFDNPDIPPNNKMNIPLAGGCSKVDFQESGLIDYGQSTIPFWDIQEVVTSPSTPLQGVSLFHKGDEEGRYGGYLALAVYNLPTTLHFT